MSWVTQEYKLISTDKGATFELYNLLNDPGETNNIIVENHNLAEEMNVTKPFLKINTWKCSEVISLLVFQSLFQRTPDNFLPSIVERFPIETYETY